MVVTPSDGTAPTDAVDPPAVAVDVPVIASAPVRLALSQNSRDHPFSGALMDGRRSGYAIASFSRFSFPPGFFGRLLFLGTPDFIVLFSFECFFSTHFLPT